MVSEKSPNMTKSREFTIKIKNETNKYTSYLKIEMKMENIKIYIWQ